MQHAWVAYAAAIVAFTAVSWSAASVLRQRTPTSLHVTILDHVYGQPCQRARMWANVFLPSYGTARISVDKKPFDLAGRPLQPNPAISAWESPSDSAGAAEFPETRSYVVDARSPDSIDFPARSTTREIQVDWLGSPQLNMPLPLAADGQSTDLGSELKLLLDKPQGLAGRWTVTGSLKHDLPAALHDVVIIVNRGQKDVNPLARGILTADAGVFKLTGPASRWEPGASLNLADVTQHANDQSVRAENYLDVLTPKSSNNYNMFSNAPAPSTTQKEKATPNEIVDSLLRISLYSVLAPPEPKLGGDGRIAARRASTHTLDLGRWFTEPCVIVIGFLDGASPVPLKVDGEPVPSVGLTAVRWVYPLKAPAPEYAPIVPQDTSGGAGPPPAPPRPRDRHRYEVGAPLVPMIETINLTKRYGELVALDSLNLTIEQGECFGFIGPNGAGKTTTIKILATLLKPTSDRP